MTLRVVFRRAAQSELEDAAVWHDEQRVGLGEEFIIEIEQAVASAAAPKRYPIVFGDIRRTVARRFARVSVGGDRVAEICSSYISDGT
jgi:plasmid stabilization system protein ParE